METPRTPPHAKQITQVMLATLLVAGTPVAVVWWLRGSGTIDSATITLLVGVALSLLTSWAGRIFWERHQGSEDLLFSELMLWGYLHRRHSQRRLSSAAELAAPLHARSGGGRDSRSMREQTRLLERLVAGMETRDPYLHGHSRRVARHSWMIARRMKLPAEEIARVRTAAALHDVGKTKTPKTILHKAGPLTDEEYRIIKLHPGEGAEMAAVLGDAELGAMIRHHHERLDGSGYPDGLRGEEIPLGARIIAVADTFDAITSARPYRAASPHRKAIDILHEEAGTRLDPDVVRAFCSHYAGRGPVAIWSFVLSLPERMLSWLTAGAGTIATAAKVAVVAAVVGGAAATSATLGLATAAPPSHLHMRAAAAGPAATAGASHLAAASGRARQGLSSAGAGAGAGATRGGHTHRHASHAPAGATSTTGAEVVPVAAQGEGSTAPAQSGGPKAAHQEAGSEETQVERQRVSETPKTTREETTAKGKGEETPAKGKTEEPVSKGKSEETAKGKTEETASKGKSEEAGKGAGEETSSKGGSGKPSSGGGSGKLEAGGKPTGEEVP